MSTMCRCGHASSQHHAKEDSLGFKPEDHDEKTARRRVCDYSGYACRCRGYSRLKPGQKIDPCPFLDLDLKRPKPAAYQPQFFVSPISLPERKSGDLEVVHVVKSGTVPVVGFRQALLRGMRPVECKLDKPILIHELRDQQCGVWMTDCPEELNQIAEMIDTVRPSGNVLVGGLGLGILATTLRDSINVAMVSPVESITVVEISPDVIRLCQPERIPVVQEDILTFLRTTPDEFDCYLLDTWQGTNESTWWSEVMPMRRIIANRWGRKKVWCWAEDIMLGQCERAAWSMGGKHWYYKSLPTDPDPKTIRRFFDDIGLPSWESEFGDRVDAAMCRTEEAS